MSAPVFRTIIEPFRIHSVEPLRMTTPDERRAAVVAAGYNLFKVHAQDVLGAQLEEVERGVEQMLLTLRARRHRERLDGVDAEGLDDRAEGCVVHGPNIAVCHLARNGLRTSLRRDGFANVL